MLGRPIWTMISSISFLGWTIANIDANALIISSLAHWAIATFNFDGNAFKHAVVDVLDGVARLIARITVHPEHFSPRLVAGHLAEVSRQRGSPVADAFPVSFAEIRDKLVTWAETDGQISGARCHVHDAVVVSAALFQQSGRGSAVLEGVWNRPCVVYITVEVHAPIQMRLSFLLGRQNRVAGCFEGHPRRAGSGDQPAISKLYWVTNHLTVWLAEVVVGFAIHVAQ